MDDNSQLLNSTTEVDFSSSTTEDEGFHDELPSRRRYCQNPLGITWYKATFLVVNAALGAGILNFPFAFSQTGGIIPGNVAHIIFFSFAVGSLIIFAFCALEKNCKTYQEVVHQYCGPTLGFVSSLVLSLYCFVTCITFIIIIGDQCDRVFASMVGPDFCYHWYLNRKFTMVASSFLLIFASYGRRIDGLKYLSYVGVAAVIYMVIVINLEFFIGNYPKGEVNVMNIDFLKFFNVVPTISFAYQCHVSSVPIMACLKKRDKPSILKTCFSAMLICFVVYTLCANCGYLTFGSLVSPDILLDYDATHWFVLVADLLLALKAWTTYPILLFCVRGAVDDVYIDYRGLTSSEAEQGEEKRRKLIAVVIWMLTIICAVFVPGLNVVVNLLGCLAAVFILIFPGMCFLQLTYLKEVSFAFKTKWRYNAQIFVSCMYIIVGAFTFGLALARGVESFMNAREEKPLCEVVGLVNLFYSY